MDDNGTVIGIKDRNCNSCGDETGNGYVSKIEGEGNASLKYVEDKQGNIKETCISDLPRQVWLEIYENIDYPTYLNLRQVSHHFLHLINEYIGVRVTFGKICSKNPAIFDFFTNVALNDVQFEEASNTEKYNFSRIFKYPSYLTDISFTGKTNLKLIQDILFNCRNLQLVEMTMDCKLLTDEHKLPDWKKVMLPGIDIGTWVPPSKSYLKYVECMKLVPGIHNDDNLRSHVVLSTLRGTNSGDNLKKVIFQCELSEEITLTNVLSITAELMEKHPKLEALFMALLNDEYLLSSEETRKFSHFMDLQSRSTEDGDFSERDLMEYFRNRIEATGIYLRIKKIGLAMLNSNMQMIWGNFLRTQHQLVHLSLTVTIEHGTFSQELFDSFSGTLEQLAIRGKFEVPFDFQHISNCMGLKEICLHNLQENGGGGIVPKCINLPQVSDGLESLILFQVVARTEEIMETATKLEKLHTLVLFKCGHAAGETGVGLECLQQILHKRSLQSILMVQFICGSTTEAESLAGVLYDMSQDRENQAGRLRSERGSSTDQQEFPEDQVEHVLDLPIVEDGGDVLTFPPAGGNSHRLGNGRVEEEDPPADRPVSRGRHRHSDTSLMDDILYPADDPNVDYFPSPPLSSSFEVEEANGELTKSLLN